MMFSIFTSSYCFLFLHIPTGRRLRTLSTKNFISRRISHFLPFFARGIRSAVITRIFISFKKANEVYHFVRCIEKLEVFTVSQSTQIGVSHISRNGSSSTRLLNGDTFSAVVSTKWGSTSNELTCPFAKILLRGAFHR